MVCLRQPPILSGLVKNENNHPPVTAAELEEKEVGENVELASAIVAFLLLLY